MAYSSLSTECGDDDSLLLELLDNVIVLVASAALAVGKPVNVESGGAILARNGPVNFPVAGEKKIFDNRPHNLCAKKGFITGRITFLIFQNLPHTLSGRKIRYFFCKYRTFFHLKNNSG